MKSLTDNLFDIPKGKLENELVEILLENKNVRIERIVSKNHTSLWYDQNEAEWVCLLTGEATLEFDDGKKTLCAGECIFIEPHQRHRVLKTTSCVWLCVFIG